MSAAFVRFAALAVPAFASAQQPPARTLATPAAEYREPFSGVTAMLEMRDGRVLVADNRDKTLQVIDLATHSATPVGRNGSGPTEWGLPLRLLRMPGDTAYVYDILNSRFLLVAPDGRAVRTYSPFAEEPTQQVMRTAPGGAADAGRGRSGADAGGRATFSGSGIRLGGMSLSGGITSATATDARGRMYFTGSAVSLPDQSGMPVSADSIPLLRQTPGSAAIDTLAYLRLPANPAGAAAPSRGGSGAFVMSLNPGRPYENGDGWTVFPDGRVVIARVADYHLDIIAPDAKRVIRGAPIRYTSVRVTEVDKELWRESRRNATPVMVTQGGGGSHALPPMPVQEPASWPEVKSVFSTNSVWAAPNGQTWIFRQRAANDRIPVADVFDVQGALVGRVSLPRDARFVGLGARGVYAIRTDDDGLQYLQRFALVWDGCPPELAENCRAR